MVIAHHSRHQKIRSALMGTKEIMGSGAAGLTLRNVGCLRRSISAEFARIFPHGLGPWFLLTAESNVENLSAVINE